MDIKLSLGFILGATLVALSMSSPMNLPQTSDEIHPIDERSAEISPEQGLSRKKRASTCALDAGQEDKFKFKHLVDSMDVGTKAAALAKSCERNFHKHGTPLKWYSTIINTVYFDRSIEFHNHPTDATSCIAYVGNAWNCGSASSKLQTKGGGKTEAGCNLDTHLCHVINCPRATKYRIKIGKSAGHYFDQEYQYCDAFDTNTDGTCWFDIYNIIPDPANPTKTLKSLACHEE